ncbi:MAG: FlgD immunoglobulin-like domain containing protein, partial [Bacteroidota bacterium]
LYSWTVTATDGIDTVKTEKPFTFRTPAPTAVEVVNTGDIKGMHVQQTYPNPFREQTTISCTLREREHLTVAVYSSNGRRMVLLADAVYDEGNHSFTWDGRDSAGSAVPPGLYFATVNTMSASEVRTMVLQR